MRVSHLGLRGRSLGGCSGSLGTKLSLQRADHAVQHREAGKHVDSVRELMAIFIRYFKHTAGVVCAPG